MMVYLKLIISRMQWVLLEQQICDAVWNYIKQNCQTTCTCVTAEFRNLLSLGGVGF